MQTGNNILTIGQTNSAAALQEREETVEVVHSCYTIYHEAMAMQLEMPIVLSIYSILYEGKCPRAALELLMARSLKQKF